MRALAILLLAVAASASHADPRERFVEPGTFLVASIDVEQLVEPKATERLLQGFDFLQGLIGQGAVPPSAERAEGVNLVAGVLRQARVREVFISVAVDDIRNGYAPLVVCELGEGSDPRQLGKWIDRSDQLAQDYVDSRIWISTPKSLMRYRDLPSAARTDLLQPLVAVGHTDPLISVVVSPGKDSRRVIREMWPAFSGAFGAVTGDMAADGFERLELTVEADGAPAARVAVVARDEASVRQMAEVANAGLSEGVAWVAANQPDYAELAGKAARLLKPTVEGTTLSCEIGAESPEVRGLFAELLVPAMFKARETALVSSKMNDMKQIALAMFNFESVNGCFPGPIVDEQGKPLLSWRVAILPFIEENALFNRFHHDEPWNSDHNLEVAKELPGVFFQNNTDITLKTQKRTTYLRPLYVGSDLAKEAGEAGVIRSRSNGKPVFYAKGDKLRWISDGTSQTILVAEVAPEHAAFWTEPADWEVDLANPLEKLRADKREGFVTAWCDGHALYLKFDVNPQTLRKAITKAGGEVISPEEWR